MMADITFVNVELESEPVEVKQECVEEQDPLVTVSLSTKGQYIIEHTI